MLSEFNQEMLLQSWIVQALGILSFFLSHYQKKGFIPAFAKALG